MELLIITGQSGAGKSQAIGCLEDMGYYCVDNLPPSMLDDLIYEIQKDPSIEKLAVVIDVRVRSFFADIEESRKNLDELNVSKTIIFLDADDKTLLMRFQETRRNHPLAEDWNIEGAISKERELLSGVREFADIIIDTSDFKNSDLSRKLVEVLGEKAGSEFHFSVSSFGFKKGMPKEADWILDARFIPNPFYVESLRYLTGENETVKEFILSFEETQNFIENMTATFLNLAPKYLKEGKHNLTIAVGCTGGKHRSVAVACEIAGRLAEAGYKVDLTHREIDK